MSTVGERVRVYCRLRPFVQDATEPEENEASDEQTFVTGSTAASRKTSVKPSGPKSVSTHDLDNGTKEFAFDGCFPEDCNQESVYNTAAKDLVQSVLDGYNATIMAYGQTGSGKTHTMMGNRGDGDGCGIIPRCLRDLFQLRRTQDNVKISASYVQVYCERVYDLLDISTAPTSLQIRESDERGVYVEGAIIQPVASIRECMEAMEKGNLNRTVASTKMNAHSSRSHAIFILHVTQTTTAIDGNNDIIQMSQLNLVDLAGSERVKKSLVRGFHVNELKAINLSLSALGNCISALSKTQSHVPYRDSKLTRLLQYSLGGNAKTSLILTVNPDVMELQESVATMQFGQRAMKVQVKATVNVVPDYKRLLEALQAKYDAQTDRLTEVDIELQSSNQQQSMLQNQLEEAKLEFSQLQFELHALRTTTRIQEAPLPQENPQNEVEDQHTSQTPDTRIDELVVDHKRELAQLKHRYDQQMETFKHVANRANQEWHNIEHELSAERTAHLATIQEVREVKEKLWAVEAQSMDRISELCQEKKEMEVQVTKLTAQIQQLTASNQDLAGQIQAIEARKDRLETSIDSNYVSRSQVNEMETLYSEAISKLQQRVESLESNKNTMKSMPQSTGLPPVKDPLMRPPPLVKQDSLMSKKAIAKIGRVVPGGRR